VAESGYSEDTAWQVAGSSRNGRDPVVKVNWDDAQVYVKWLSEKAQHQYRLLSESEFEYAERAGSRTGFWWGDEAASVCLYANFHDCSSGPTRVGAYRPNAFGLDDMAGNTFEWVEDCWHESYQGAPDDGTPWTDTGCSVRAMEERSGVGSIMNQGVPFERATGSLHRDGPGSEWNDRPLSDEGIRETEELAVTLAAGANRHLFEPVSPCSPGPRGFAGGQGVRQTCVDSIEAPPH
jgi:formylglycine-generating enzyme required for sulfatase activity